MKLTQSEWLIMNALWEYNPATARELMEILPGDIQWAYTTVKTMLSRLETKGIVTERKRGNTSFYTPLVSRSKARRSALSSLIDQAFGGTVEPLLHFMVNNKKLSKKQKQELIRILREEDIKKEKKDDKSP